MTRTVSSNKLMKPKPNAWWLLNSLWRYYLNHLEKPVSDSQHFFIGISVIPQERLLPVLRSLWAAHLRGLRRDRWGVERAQLNKLRHVTYNPGPAIWHPAHRRLAQLERIILKCKPRVSVDEVAAVFAHYY